MFLVTRHLWPPGSSARLKALINWSGFESSNYSWLISVNRWCVSIFLVHQIGLTQKDDPWCQMKRQTKWTCPAPKMCKKIKWVKTKTSHIISPFESYSSIQWHSVIFHSNNFVKIIFTFLIAHTDICLYAFSRSASIWTLFRIRTGSVGSRVYRAYAPSCYICSSKRRHKYRK